MLETFSRNEISSISLLVALVRVDYMVSDGYVKYEDAEVHLIDELSCNVSEIMRKKIKWLTGGHFGCH